MDAIDNIYFINMDSSVERRNQIERQQTKFSNKFGKPFTRIPAVMGKSLSDIQLDKSCTPFMKNFSTRSGIGCFLSHKRIWKRMVKNNESYAVVLEDDCELVDDCEMILDASLTELFEFDPDWDFLYGGYTGVFDDKNMSPLDYLVTRFEKPFIKNKDTSSLQNIFIPYCPLGTHCYVISLPFAKYLLQRFAKIECHVDIAIRRCRDKRVYGCVKPIGYQTMEDSIIRENVFPVTLHSIFRNFHDRNNVSYDTLLNYPAYEIRGFQLSYYFLIFISVTCMYPDSFYVFASVFASEIFIQPTNYNLVIPWVVCLIIIYQIRTNVIS